MTSLIQRMVAAGLGMTLALPALAGLPAAMDRAPSDAAVVIGIKNVDSFNSRLKELASSLGMDDGPAGFPGIPEEFLKTDGMNREGSVAVVMLDGARMGPGTQWFAIAPVTDFDAFISGFGGEIDGDIGMISPMGESFYSRDIGGGYAILGPQRGVIGDFEPRDGQAAEFEQMMGTAGRQLVESSDLIISANIPALRPVIEQAINEMREAMEFMAMMAGDDAEDMQAGMEMIAGLMKTFSEEAKAGLMGLGMSDAGVSLDFAANFREGTEMAGYFQAPGEARGLLSRVPDMPYLIAGSFDTSSPGMRQLMTAVTEAQAKMGGDMAKHMDLLDMSRFIDLQDGSVFVLGESPALLGGGLFANTLYYYKSSAPADLVAASRDATREMDDTEVDGIRFSTSWQEGATTISNTTVDSWSVRMQFDPNVPEAAQVQMITSTIFGPEGGPSGYVAQTDDGVIMTLSRNSQLVERAIAAARDGNGLGSNQSMRRIAEHLPSDTTFEGYLNVGGVLRSVGGMLAMMGMPMQMDPPEDMLPVAMGMTTNDGGMRTKIFVPTDVMKAVREIVKDMGPAMQPGGGRQQAPRF